MSRWELVQNAVGAVSVVLIVVLLWAGLVGGPGGPSVPSSSARASDSAPEDPGSGDPGPGDPEPAAAAVARPEALLVVTGREDVASRLSDELDAEAALHRGQGFATGPGLFTVLPADLEGRQPAAVVLQGGEADVEDPARAGRAVEQMVDRVRAEGPADLPLLVVGPLAADPAAASPALLAVRDAVAAAAAAKDVGFLDPLALDPEADGPVIDQLGARVAALLDLPVSAE